MKKEIQYNQALNAHLLNFEQIQKKMSIPTTHSPIDPAAGAKVDMPSPGFSGSGKPFENVPGFRILDDGKAEVYMYAPGAKRVEIAGIGGSMQGRWDLTDQGDGYWKAKLDEVRSGFHFCVFIVDGVLTYNPVMPFGFGASYVMNFFEVPEDNVDFYLLKDVPHGTIHMELMKSETTGRYRNLWVYTPYGYETSNKKYPVMHILHGGGENETGWFWLGKLNYIADNLISEGKCEEMIIVASSFAAPKEVEENVFIDEGFPEIMCNEIVPFIDAKYRTIADREHRAMAGLSAGGGMSRRIAHGHPECFANLGQFSCGGGFSVAGITKTQGGFQLRPDGTMQVSDGPRYDELFSSPEHYNSTMKVTFVTCGTDDPRHKYTQPQVQELIDLGYNFEYSCYPGFHEWDVWRYSARDFMMRLFK